MEKQEHFRKYSIPERRRCDHCGTKSYSKFIGKIELSAYHCEKCQHIFYIIEAPPEFSEIPRGFWSQLTIDDLKLCLESSHYRWPTFQKRLRKKVKEEMQKREREEDYIRPRSLRDLMKTVLNQISIVENKNGVKLGHLLVVLKHKHNIDEDTALRLIEQLKKEKVIYEPKKGYLRAH